MAHKHIEPVPLEKAYRILNHGPTVLVSARQENADSVMAAAWCCALDFDPPKLTVVIDRNTYTRTLVEAAGRFAIQVPTARQLDMVYQLGTRSTLDEPNKLTEIGVQYVAIEGYDFPFVSDCSAWLLCQVLPANGLQEAHDLFLGEIVSAWADTRIFRDGRWHFETSDPGWRSLHHVAGGQFYAIGDSLQAK